MAYRKNPLDFSSEIGSAFSGLANAFLQGQKLATANAGTEADIAYKDILGRKAQAEAEREQRKNRAISGIEGGLGAIMAPRAEPAPSPSFTGPMPAMAPEAAFQAGVQENLPRLLENAMMGGVDPAQVGTAVRALAANAGLPDSVVARAMVGSGKAIGENDSFSLPGQAAIRADNQQFDIAKTIAGEQAKPVSVGAGVTVLPGVMPGGGTDPRFGGRAQVTGLPTESTVKGGALANIMAEQGPEAVMAAGKTGGQPFNYVAPDGRTYLTRDGVSDVNGNVLPQGGYRAGVQGDLQGTGVGGLTKPNQTVVQGRIMSGDAAVKMIGSIRDMVTRDPNLVGPVGNVRRLAQDATDIFGSVAPMFGGRDQAQQQVAAARNDLVAKYGPAAQTLLPELFNPDLNSIETLNGLLVYKAAEAFGQSGRGASDADIKRIQATVGMPNSWVTGPQTYLNKLETLMGILTFQGDADRRLLSEGVGGAQQPAGNLGNTMTGGTPAPAAAPPRRRYNPATGNIE